ncbi:MAG: hypothetical protein A3B11_00875 [Candidatus Taylorbacteria bacterium RIFCSPLOWO2_01_FULL_44_26]|uniref:Abortive infection protein-like C-terminal domain-containing protein n=2 Tax=Parcubacteria group TaxID=1794811 RepID=A0A1G2N5W2_9BACT|nr:MAG: hypothetical protein A2647_01280 [Candidatus Nomurabacteria bacterium RIFCSPHIGHO2_01_FULL_40_24b]OHA31498.1 MAG: hypothetical protein A3B11_00875 [Candidatus Taylorbacteria bacterium RIFCSPLOWO2_01_FULL_44_26]
MSDDFSKQSVGENILPPVSLTLEQENLCDRLDNWYSHYELKFKPSDMFRGALFALRPECRSNPDLIAQAAHSLRDILYPFGKKDISNKEKALKEYGSVKAGELSEEVGRIFGSLTELAHHGNGHGKSVDFSKLGMADFEHIVSEFERIMIEALTRQLDVHNEIDQLLTQIPT